jgi:hypothetical protein
MFLTNTFQWPWTRIAGLAAPRPLLFVNSDNDRIFPMDANERIMARLERLYSLYGAGDRVDAVVSVGGHAYREDIRQAVYRFVNAHLKSDPRPVTDGELDVVSEGAQVPYVAIPYEKLRVFPTDADLPVDQINTKIDETFVPMAPVEPPKSGEYDVWRAKLVAELRRVSFANFPANVAAAKKVGEADEATDRLSSEDGIEFRLRYPSGKPSGSVLLVVLNEDEAATVPEWLESAKERDDTIVLCEVRGIGATRWTQKDPPNYVARSHALLGRTVDSGRVWDVIAAAKYLAMAGNGGKRDVRVAGKGAAGVIATYAAALDDQIAAVTVVAPPPSHMDTGAPQFLNVLRVCDVPVSLGLVAPRPLKLIDAPGEWKATQAVYAAAGAADKLSLKSGAGFQPARQ